MGKLQIDVPQAELAEFCERNHIRKLSFFGSVTREDFNDDSDIDVLVEFDPDHVPGLAFFGMPEELESILRRHVDVCTPSGLRRSTRESILTSAVEGYVAE